DGVGQVQVLVARPLVEADDVVAELPAAAVEELTPPREGGEHRGDVIRRPPHETVRALGPEPVDGPAAPEVFSRARDEPHRPDPLPAGGIDAGGDVEGLAGRVVPLGDSPDGLGKGRVLRHVIDALAVEEDGPPVAQTREVVSASAHGANGVLYFIRPWILAMAVRAHSSSISPPGAPLTPIPPIAFPSTMMVTPPTAYVTLGRGVCGTVVAGFLPIRSATAFVLSSLRARVREAAE